MSVLFPKITVPDFSMNLFLTKLPRSPFLHCQEGRLCKLESAHSDRQYCVLWPNDDMLICFAKQSESCALREQYDNPKICSVLTWLSDKPVGSN